MRAGNEVNITGGTFGKYADGEYNPGSMDLETRSALHVTGTDFWLGGNPIEIFRPIVRTIRKKRLSSCALLRNFHLGWNLDS